MRSVAFRNNRLKSAIETALTCGTRRCCDQKPTFDHRPPVRVTRNRCPKGQCDNQSRMLSFHEFIIIIVSIPHHCALHDKRRKRNKSGNQRLLLLLLPHQPTKRSRRQQLAKWRAKLNRNLTHSHTCPKNALQAFAAFEDVYWQTVVTWSDDVRRLWTEAMIF